MARENSVLEDLSHETAVAEYYLDLHEAQTRAKENGDAYDATMILSADEYGRYAGMRRRSRAATRHIAARFRAAEYGWQEEGG